MTNTLPTPNKPGVYLNNLFAYIVDTLRNTPLSPISKVDGRVAVVQTLSMRDTAKVLLGVDDAT